VRVLAFNDQDYRQAGAQVSLHLKMPGIRGTVYFKVKESRCCRISISSRRAIVVYLLAFSS